MNNVTIIDSTKVPRPEDRAVLQALASRSLKPIEEHVLAIDKNKTDNFTSKHIIGYGHDSVSENADGIIISCPNVSIIAAKAIEDNSLFKGTESSTRYIDFSKQPFITPNIEKEYLLEKQRRFYLYILPEIENHFLGIYPFEGGEYEIYKKAIKAKAFDVARAFLPAGATTLVNWSTDIRTAKAHLRQMVQHDVIEVKNLALTIIEKLKGLYPVSMSGDLTGFEHINKWSDEYFYLDEDPVYNGTDVWENPNYTYSKFDVGYVEKDIETVRNNYPSLAERPKGCPLPRIYSSRVTIAGLLDYGSFRDIQRQRNGVCKIPILNTQNGFEAWYIDQLPFNLRNEAKAHINEVKEEIEKDFIVDYDAQYLVPLGFRIPFILDYSLEQCVYVSELRSSKHVHPTARNVGLHIADFLDEKYPFVKTYIDRSDSPFNLKRGTHDIKGV